jgi:NAD(P)-dependent dehydrogenase (short-subunit alcohol dehydrogenase family)
MKNVIVITGASSGIGLLAARALARAGHIVYASMRETESRNASLVKEVEKHAAEYSVDLRAIELDVSSQDLLMRQFKKSSQRTAAWMWSFTMPATWSLVRPKPSHLSNLQSCMTSMSLVLNA